MNGIDSSNATLRTTYTNNGNNSNPSKLPGDLQKKLDTFMAKKDNFSGVVLVAKDGNIVIQGSLLLIGGRMIIYILSKSPAKAKTRLNHYGFARFAGTKYVVRTECS